MAGKVLAVNVSERRGEIKQNINDAFLKENYGLAKDAHSGDWHRQVSLLSLSVMKKCRPWEQLDLIMVYLLKI